MCEGCPKTLITPVFRTTRFGATIIQTIGSRWLWSERFLSLILLILRKLLQSLEQEKAKAQLLGRPLGTLGLGRAEIWGDRGPAPRSRRKRSESASCGGSGCGVPADRRVRPRQRRSRRWKGLGEGGGKGGGGDGEGEEGAGRGWAWEEGRERRAGEERGGRRERRRKEGGERLELAPKWEKGASERGGGAGRAAGSRAAPRLGRPQQARMAAPAQ